MKICKKCHLPKPEDSFSRDKSKEDGLHIYCKPCYAILHKKWRLDNPEKVGIQIKKGLKKTREWQKKNAEKIKGYTRQTNLKRKAIREEQAANRSKINKMITGYLRWKDLLNLMGIRADDYYYREWSEADFEQIELIVSLVKFSLEQIKSIVSQYAKGGLPDS